MVNSTAGGGTGALNGLLGGGTGLIPATNVTGNSTYLTAYDPPSSSDNSTISTKDVSDNSTMTIKDDPCSVTAYSPAFTLLLGPFAPYDAKQALIYRYHRQQSVNLGSWFVQERWMDPTLFTCASGNKQAELDVANGWGSVDDVRQVLERHWDEWITEKDFE